MFVIDSDKYSASGIETLVFPGGEPHVKVPQLPPHPLLYLKLRTWIDVGHAALLVDACDRLDVGPHIFMPYLPGARQDRSDGSCGHTLWLTSRMFAAPVYTFDVHSQAACAHMKIRQNFMPADLQLEIPYNVAGVIAPDEGAVNRAMSFRNRFFPRAELLCATKQRDPHTGLLTNYRLERPSRRGHYIVVDDICDGGGTFNLLAQAFGNSVGYNADRYSLELYVSHGIFSKGVDALSQMYCRITTTDSWCRLPSGGRLNVISLAPLLTKISGEEQ
jgi:ribose-phosphate pyrophosphokinase